MGGASNVYRAKKTSQRSGNIRPGAHMTSRVILLGMHTGAECCVRRCFALDGTAGLLERRKEKRKLDERAPRTAHLSRCEKTAGALHMAAARLLLRPAAGKSFTLARFTNARWSHRTRLVSRAT